jgi:transposase
MNYEYYIGIDTSKKKLDIYVLKNNKKVLYTKIANTRKGFKTLKEKLQLPLEKALFCVENTGIYNYHLLKWIAQKDHQLWVESSLAIKRSLGLTRGKNDQIDAKRIAMYASMHHANSLKLWEAPREIIEELEELNWARNKIKESIKQYKKPIQEIETIKGKQASKKSLALFQNTLKALEKDLKQIEKKIQKSIKSDKKVAHTFEILTSIPGIGPITAQALIVSTNEFKKIKCPKKFSCYIGVAPFDHTSGSSIRGKSRVSHFANKKLKSLLHMGATSVIRLPGELSDFYKRLIAKGKAKMVAINAVRRKLVHLVYSCIRDDRMYEKTYTKNFEMS